MLIAVDIGNTNTSIGIFNDGSGSSILHYANVQTDKQATADEIAIKFSGLKDLWGLSKQEHWENVMICSVVPQVDYEFKHLFEKYFFLSPRFVGIGDTTLVINYDFPGEIGADRIVNAEAGVRCFPGENLIIVDFGTATTLDIVSGNGIYEGGLIMTGIMSSLRALEEKASKLPHIDLMPASRLVGKNTVECIRSGILNGNGAMVDELVARIKNEMGWKSAKVIATGGLSKLIKNSSQTIDFIDNLLTLKGLFFIWQNKYA